MFASVVPERIVGERVELVRHRLDLARAAAEAIDESIEHLRPWQPWIAKYEGVQSCIQYAEWVAPQWGRRFDYQILRRTDRCFLGQANLESFNREVPSIMIGYWLRRSATGHGYATETAKLLRDMAFETLKVVRLELLCDVKNRKSAGIAKRLSMKLEGVLRNERRNAEGKLQDTMVWSMTLGEYRALKRLPEP